jgi:hypothetical protein
MQDHTRCKKRFTSFPSPAEMSLTKLSLGRNNSVMTSLFPPRESLVVTGNSRTFFYGVGAIGRGMYSSAGVLTTDYSDESGCVGAPGPIKSYLASTRIHHTHPEGFWLRPNYTSLPYPYVYTPSAVFLQ